MIWSTLRARELGKSVSKDLVWRADLNALSQLHVQPTWKTDFKPVTSGCRDYIVQLSASKDQALLAGASSNGTIEVHEPEDGTDSLRLKLSSNHSSRVAALTWGKGAGDHLYVAHEGGTIHVFDLNRFSNAPTRVISEPGNMRFVTDIITIDENLIAVAHDELLHIYDIRERWKRKYGATTRIGKEIAVAASGVELYIASPGTISLYDRRQLPQARAYLSMERTNTNVVLSSPLPEHSRLDMLRTLAGAPRGFLFYRTAKGTTGYIDMVGKAGEHITAASPPAFVESSQVSLGETGLQSYGTVRRSYDRSWHVRKRLGDVVCASHGNGWRAIFPQMFRASFEVVLFGHGRPIESYERTVENEVACMHAVGRKLGRIALGGVRNEMQMLQVDCSPSPIPLQNPRGIKDKVPSRTWWSRLRDMNDSDTSQASAK
ncbi:WD40/YVTN repeat-like containing protein [Gracilaria domingensis]|nr:WD40/YVTN repeat-like containing protein [Gracilaria domingensis]